MSITTARQLVRQAEQLRRLEREEAFRVQSLRRGELID